MTAMALPSSALGPSQSDNEVSIHTIIPVHRVLAVVQVVGEIAKVAVVVLDVVDAAGATRHETTFGLSFRLGFDDRSGHGSRDQEACQPRCRDLHVGWQRRENVPDTQCRFDLCRSRSVLSFGSGKR